MRYRYAKPRSDEEKKEIYDKWHKLINMSQSALDDWAENDHRLLASINRSEAKEEGGIQSGYDSFHRIKRRKEKKFEDWSAEDFDNASQENGFNSRMLGGKPGDIIGDSGMSKWEISLRNWGHDPSLKSSPQHTKWKTWKMKQNKKTASDSPTPSNVILDASKAIKGMAIDTRKKGLELPPELLELFYSGFKEKLKLSVLKHLDFNGKLEFMSLQRSVGKIKGEMTAIVTAFQVDPKARAVGSTWKVMMALINRFEQMLKASVQVENNHLKIIEQNFTYKGFRVKSLNLSDTEVRGLLDSIAYVDALFTRRNFTDLVRGSISHITLRDPTMREKKKGVSGLYNSETKELTILSTKSKGRFVENFVHETLIHEIGHWVHLTYITREAKEFWDSGWDMITQQEEKFFSENIKKMTITPEDRQRYFDLFVEHKGSASKVKRKLSALDQLKVHEMSTSFAVESEPLMTPKNFRLSKRGKHLAQAFVDPLHFFYEIEGYSREDYTEEEAKERALSEIKRTWFKIEGMFKDLGITMDSDKAREFASQDKALHEQTILELKEALGIPTNYGRTNVAEDFAETFVGFILNPDQLSQTARWRMGRTLGLSQATGNRVMKLSKKIANKYLTQGRNR